MKRILAALVIVVLALSLSACSPVKISKDGVQIKGPDGSTISVGDKVSLPDGYPKDVVPIMSGGKVIFANKSMDDNKKPVYYVMVEIEKPPADVSAYYKEALKNATNLSDMMMDDMHIISGTKDGQDFGVTLTATDDKKGATATITILPMSSSSSNPSSGTSTTVSGQGGTIPEGYPKNVAPIIAGATVDMGIKTTEENLDKFSLLLLSDKPIAEVTAYYKNAVKDSIGYQEVIFGDVSTMSGEKDSYRFTVGVTPTDPGEPKKGTHVQIHMEQLSTASTGTGTSSSVTIGTPSDSGDVSLQAGYPSNVVPIIAQAKLVTAVKEVEDGKDSHTVELLSAKTLKDVLTYYENALKGAEDYEQWGDEDSGHSLYGIKGGYEVYIDIAFLDDGTKQTWVFITLNKQ